MHFPLRFGMTNVAAIGGGAEYVFTNAEAEAYVESLSSDPGNAWKEIFDTLVGALKAASIYSKYDAIWLFQNVTQEAALTNLVNPGTHDATFVNSPTFTEAVGIATNGTDNFIDTNFNPSTASSPRFVLEDASFGIWSLTSDAQPDISGSGRITSGLSAYTFIKPRITTTNTFIFRINGGNSSGTASNSDGSGFYKITRRGATDVEAYKNGASVATSGVSSTNVNTDTLTIGSMGTSNYEARQYAIAAIGSGFSDDDALAEYNAFNAYRTAVAAL